MMLLLCLAVSTESSVITSDHRFLSDWTTGEPISLREDVPLSFSDNAVDSLIAGITSAASK